MPIYLDIETCQQDVYPWMVPDVASEDPPATHKKPETIAKWREERAASIQGELRERSSLEALLGGTVACVGIAVGDKPVSVLVAPSMDEAGELALLKKLEAGLARYPEHPLVAYSGSRFDFAYLRHRAIRHGLYALARRCWQPKPWSQNCIDPFLAWQGSDRTTKGKLTQVAQFLGIEAPDTVTGKDVQALLDAGDIEAVKAHCAEDVRLLREIFACFAAAGWVEGQDPDNYAPRAPAPPRLTTLQQVHVEMVELSPALIQDAATEAGIPWTLGSEVGEAGPNLQGATREALQGFLRALHGRRIAA